MGESRISCSIRDLCEDEALEVCEQLQREVWQFQTPDLVSARMLRTCLDCGGIVLGASLQHRGIIGFVFSFPVLWGGRVIQHSHMLAVLPEFQNSGIGESLKQEQLKRAKAQGIKIITWTFDPLECRNAHLNLNKLGVVIRRYYKNLYGESTTSELHSGLGTDRFLAEWYVDQRISIAPRTTRLPRPVLVKTHTNERGLPVPDEIEAGLDARRLYLEIPWNIQELKSKDRALAVEWREVTRSVLAQYLNGRYQADALIRCTDADRQRAFYRLSRIDDRRQR